MLGAISFDLNLAVFLQPAMLLSIAGGLLWSVKAIKAHQDKAIAAQTGAIQASLDSKTKTLTDAVKSVDKKVDDVIVTQKADHAELVRHGEDIAFLKGVAAERARITDAAAAFGHALAPEETRHDQT